MGAYPSHTLPVTEESFHAFVVQEFLEQHPVLKQYSIDKAYTTGSGRLFRTYRIRHRHAPETVAILKAAWLKEDAWSATTTNSSSNNTTTATATAATAGAATATITNSADENQQNTPKSYNKTTSAIQSMLSDLEQLQRAARDAVLPYTLWCDRKVIGGSVSGGGMRNGSSVRAVALLRPHIYTTLKDRLSTRPFWGNAEKVYAIVQLLQAVRTLHQAGLCHGHLSADNIGVTSVGRIVLLDGVPAFKKTTMPDNDPTEYLYYFQKTSYATTTSTEETPCYLAPERFVSGTTATTTAVTPAMDIFSIGCLVVEICLNEGSCFDHLGQLLAYAHRDDTAAVQQRLSKMESSALRAAAKHMLSRNPTERLSAGGYLERLEATGQIPATFGLLDRLIADDSSHNVNNNNNSTDNNGAVVVTPDARLVQCVKLYPEIIHAALGKTLPKATMAKWRRWTQTTKERSTSNTSTTSSSSTETGDNTDDSATEYRREPLNFAEMLAETEALLQALDEQVVPLASEVVPQISKGIETDEVKSSSEEAEERSDLCRSSLIIYLQIMLSALRHVQRPASKWAALQLVDDMSKSNYISDEARLQRITPVAVSLLHDADALVRATALTVLTHTLTQVTVFSPSDAPIIPQYVAKRVSHLPADPALLVRLAFGQCMPLLAEVAQRFLDVTHAVRIYEAVGGAGSSSGYTTEEDTVFSEDVTQLLDTAATTSGVKGEGGEKTLIGNKTLLGSTYSSERESLSETISRWVIHMSTDQSEDASLPKRAMLHRMGKLCTFFGQQGVMSFLLPQIVTFLNDRKDWQLRAALFQNLTPVCQKIGRAATEEFALPCLEIGFVDSEEQVIRCALNCLYRLVELGLLSRGSLLGIRESSMSVRTNSNSILERYVIFLIHPSEGIRKAAVALFVTACQVVGSPDVFVYILPTLKPLLRYQPTVHHLQDSEKLQRCLQLPWSRAQFQRELEKASTNPSSGVWTTVGTQGDASADKKSKPTSPEVEDSQVLQVSSVNDYLRMLAMHNIQMSSVYSQQVSRVKDKPTIEANLKLAQSVMFPRQNFRTVRPFLPEWYEHVQQKTIEENSSVTAQSTIRSISALGAVYGISIMGPIEGTTENIIGAAAEDSSRLDTSPTEMLDTESTKVVEAASLGQWTAESVLDADIIDSSLLVSKLKALGVPQLPPKLGEHIVTQKPPVKNTARGGPKEPAPTEWRPRINSLVATSSTISGHKAPVVRLAVSVDSSFFISGSHDGTCAVWETSQLDESVGVLENSLVYSGHADNKPARINDVAMVEGTHSVVSGDSNGGVHVWRIDMVQSTSLYSGNRTARAVGTSDVRQIHPGEGEVLAVTHFTGLSTSIVLFASQKGSIHSWDLRCAQEPFLLRHSPGLGHLTTMALGNDRQWLVAGTNKGYLALWDIRFQNAVKLWRHEAGEKIHRAATSFVPPPQSWAGRFSNTESRPFVFLGTGANECGMFDLISGSCKECFRTIPTDSKIQNEGLPSLFDIPISTKPDSCVLTASGPQFQSPTLSSYPSINCMVGSVGGQNQSFLVTGGSDRRIRFWDFATPSRCYTTAGETSSATRPSYERIDFEGPRRLMLCRQPPALALRESGRIGNYTYHGMKKPENHHTDSVMDLKIIDNGLVSCSRDSTVKIWR